MSKMKLEPYGDITADLLCWIKHYMRNKIATLSHAKVKDNADPTALAVEMVSAATDGIEKVDLIAKEAIAQGVKSLSKYKSVMLDLYAYVEKNKETFQSIKDVTGITLVHFANVEHSGASESRKDDLFQIAVNFFNFIDDNTREGEHLFNITEGANGQKITRSGRRKPKPLPDHLDEHTLRRFNKKLPNLEYKSEFERFRDILIARIFLFAGVTTEELLNLKDDDLAADEAEPNEILWVNVRGKGAAKRSIPVPKRKIVVYLNGYLEQRGKSGCGFLFCGTRNAAEQIDANTVRGIIKRLFDAAGIKGEASPLVLRNTFGVFVYRQLVLRGNKNAVKYVQELMGHSDQRTTKRLVMIENPDKVLAAEVFSEFEE